jgi:hypothetical protein
MTDYLMPPLESDLSGQSRRAGFEFEFGNLPVIETARELQKALGGELDSKSPFEVVLENSELGRLKIERDAELLKSVKYRRWLESIGVAFFPGTIAHEIESNIDNASRNLIPCEVVTSPIPLGNLHKLEILVSTLEKLGAEGTQESLFYAFGMHINPSTPDLSSATLTHYLQAFLLLHPWILAISDIDMTRRFLTKYIDPYPPEYMELVLDPAYTPNEDQFIADYLTHNPTRNRALDMLPILCEMQPETVAAGVNEDEQNLVKGRPAFHYRLPDCKLNVQGWSPASAWNQWVAIEKLASKEALLRELIGEWRESNARFSLLPNSAWVDRLGLLLSQKFFGL